MLPAEGAVRFHFTHPSDPFSENLGVDISSRTASASVTQAASTTEAAGHAVTDQSSASASTSQVKALTADMQKLAITTPSQAPFASLADEPEGLITDTPPLDAIPKEQRRHYNMVLAQTSEVPEFDPAYDITERDICQLIPGTIDGFREDVPLQHYVGPDPPHWQDSCDPPHWED